MLSDVEYLELITQSLKEKIQEPVAYVRTIRGKALKAEFRALVAQMTEGDEMWEWEWWGPTEPRNAYSLGWCIVGNGKATAFYCYSFS